MTDSSYTHITVVLDRSGSMQLIDRDTVGGLNAFIDEQKKIEGKATMTLYRFDDTCIADYTNKDIKDVPHLTSVEPRGNTAMFDAIAQSINTLGKELRNTPEEKRPGKVVFVIITDGEENASKEYRRSTIKEMIEHQRHKYNWNFVYLGANQDAVANGKSMGISTANSSTYNANATSVNMMFAATSHNIGTLRSCNVVGAQLTAYSAEQREDMKQ